MLELLPQHTFMAALNVCHRWKSVTKQWILQNKTAMERRQKLISKQGDYECHEFIICEGNLLLQIEQTGFLTGSGRLVSTRMKTKPAIFSPCSTSTSTT